MICERRRRQTSLFKWADLEPALTAPSKPLEPAVNAPITPTLEPALTAQVLPALSAPRKDTRKDTNINPPYPLKKGDGGDTAFSSSPKATAEGEKTPPPAEPSSPESTPPLGKEKDGSDVPPPAGAKGTGAGKGKAKKTKPELNPHPVLLEWNEARTVAGLDPSVVGPQNNAFAKKLEEAVPDADLRRKVLDAFFARKSDPYLVNEGFVFFQLVNHRLDQCIAAARKNGASSNGQKPARTESTGEAKRQGMFFRKDR